jgi:hypothetical protein
MTKKWKIKLNESKSLHIKFTLRKDHCPAVNKNQTIIPQTEAVKYLRLQFDFKLILKEHVAKKENKSPEKRKRSTRC